MSDDTLKFEVERLRDQNGRLLALVDELRSKVNEPEDVIRAIRQGEIDALVVEEEGHEEIYSLLRFDSAYRTVVEECFPFGVWLAESDGRLLYVTPAFLTALGSNLAELRQKGQFHFVAPDSRQTIVNEWRRCRASGEPLNVHYPIYFANGSERIIWTHGTLTRTHDGQERWVGVNIDITEREKILQRLHQQATALQEADRRKDVFLATMAHELRNPLAPIRNAIELLRRSGTQSKPVEAACQLMERQFLRIVRIVDDLLDVSRISTGKIRLQKERVELAALVRTAAEAAHPLLESKGHHLTIALPLQPIVLEADPARLTQVLANLLDNAAKYTERNGCIRLAAEAANDEVRIEIQDNGVGISAEHLGHIFDAFSQIAPVSEQSLGGLGIGLSLAKGLVELHGGRIEVSSEGTGKGSRFVVSLPLEDAAAAPSSPAAASDRKGPSAAHRILVVDDNRDAADSLAVLLRLMGHDISRAYDGLQAIKVADELRPGVILMDIGLPRMNGYDVARRIREKPWGKSMTLIALTGWGQEEDKRRAKEAGFDHHLIKPVEISSLEALLARIAD